MPGMTRPGATGQRIDVSGQSGGGGGAGGGGGLPGGSSGFGLPPGMDPSRVSRDPLLQRMGQRTPSYADWESAGYPMGSYGTWRNMMQKRWDQRYWEMKNQGRRGLGSMGSRSSRGPTSPWGSGNTMRPGGEQSPALASMFGGGSDEQLMAILQQLGIGG